MLKFIVLLFDFGYDTMVKLALEKNEMLFFFFFFFNYNLLSAERLSALFVAVLLYMLLMLCGDLLLCFPLIPRTRNRKRRKHENCAK